MDVRGSADLVTHSLTLIPKLTLIASPEGLTYLSSPTQVKPSPMPRHAMGHSATQGQRQSRQRGLRCKQEQVRADNRSEMSARAPSFCLLLYQPTPCCTEMMRRAPDFAQHFSEMSSREQLTKPPPLLTLDTKQSKAPGHHHLAKMLLTSDDTAVVF